MNLELKLLKFLEKNIEKGATLLLALSGGPDSFSLAYLLLEAQKKIHFTFEVAHVDHNARLDSAQEALAIKNWAQKYNVPFHLKKLENIPSQNKEDFFRQKRYEFFLHLFEKKNYQALLLAHHQNDLEETVLKRVLEGATFENLSPLKEISHYQTIKVWRPFLSVSKADVIKYITQKGWHYFIDPTNFDGSNLRSKMREKVIPDLEKALGKNIRSNLAALSKLSENFESYMNSKVNVDKNLNYSKLGYYFDFSQDSFHPFELLYGLKKSLRQKEIDLNRKELLNGVDWILEKTCQKKYVKKSSTLYFDRGRVFVLPTKNEELASQAIALKEGTYFFGFWEVRVEKAFDNLVPKEQSWKDLFNEECVFLAQLPEKEYFLRKPSLKEDRLIFGKRLFKFLQEHLVPSCLYPLLPVIVSDEKIVAEFFTGKIISNPGKNSLNIYLSFKKD